MLRWPRFWPSLLDTFVTLLHIFLSLLCYTFILLRQDFLCLVATVLFFSVKVIKRIYFYYSFLPVKSRLNEYWIIMAISRWLAAKSHISMRLWSVCVCVLFIANLLSNALSSHFFCAACRRGRMHSHCQRPVLAASIQQTPEMSLFSSVWEER